MAVIVLFCLNFPDTISQYITETNTETVCPCDSSHHVFCTTLVLHPVPGGKLTAKILDKKGAEVPRADYNLEVDGEDFTFKFKKPFRSRSGRYSIVFSYDGADTEKDIMVNFLGEF